MKGEMLRSLVKSDGWKVAKEMLDREIDMVKYVSTLNLSDSIEDIGKEAYARAKAVELVQGWFNDINAEIESYWEYMNPEEDTEEPIIVDTSA